MMQIVTTTDITLVDSSFSHTIPAGSRGSVVDFDDQGLIAEFDGCRELTSVARGEYFTLGGDLPLRYTLKEAAQILRISRATLYLRVAEGLMSVVKDGSRTFITDAELRRYLAACEF